MSSNNNSLAQIGATPGVTIKPNMPGLTFGPQPKPAVSNQSNALSPGQNGGATKPQMGTNPGLIQPVTPVKKITNNNVDGSSTVHEFHAPEIPATTSADKFDRTTGNPNPNYIDPTITKPQPSTPQVGSASTNAQGVLNAGNQTPQENQTYSGLLNLSQNESPQVAKARQDLIDAQEQFAKQTHDINTSGTWTSRALGEQGQANIRNSAILNALQGGVSNALTSQGQQISAGSAANSAAQTTAQRAQSAAGTVLSASLPGQISGSARTYNPLDSTGTQGTNGIVTGANNQSVYDLTNQYNQGLVGLNAADGIKNQIISTLQSNPTLNSTPISAITNLNELFSGQTSQPGQQLLAQQIHQYITSLGIDPATATSIASQKQGTLAQLLDSLRQTAQANNDALKTTRDSLQGSQSSGSTTGANPWH